MAKGKANGAAKRAASTNGNGAIGATAPELSDATLERTPARVLDFLTAVRKNRLVRAILAAHGYTAAMHAQGWDLLRATGAWEQDDGAVESTSDPEAGAALATVDAWDEDAFTLIDGALKYDYPAQYARLTAKLKPAQGESSVLVVDELLARLDDLESGPRDAKGRRPARDARSKAARARDHAALALLAERGIGKPRRDQMRALVGLARGFGAVVVPTAQQQAQQEKAEQARRQTLLELRKWWESASSIARVHVKRRDHLISLGLAERAAPARSTGAGAGSATANGGAASADSAHRDA